MNFSHAHALREARRSLGLSQEELARRAGLSRLTVQKLEAGAIDPRVSTLVVLLRALELELVLGPTAYKEPVETFVRAGARAVSQPAGVGAPPSIVDVLTKP